MKRIKQLINDYIQGIRILCSKEFYIDFWEWFCEIFKIEK